MRGLRQRAGPHKQHSNYETRHVFSQQREELRAWVKQMFPKSLSECSSLINLSWEKDDDDDDAECSSETKLSESLEGSPQ